MARPRAQPATRRSWLWLQGLICGAVITTVPGLALVIAVLLAPAFAAVMIEPKTARPAYRSMLLMGAASVFMPLRHLWDHGGSLDAALEVLGDPGVPLLSWLACGGGWLASQIAELAIRLAFSSSSVRLAKSLRQERDDLLHEWPATAPER